MHSKMLKIGEIFLFFTNCLNILFYVLHINLWTLFDSGSLSVTLFDSPPLASFFKTDINTTKSLLLDKSLACCQISGVFVAFILIFHSISSKVSQ